jgi:hypothetical protein
LGKFSAPRQIRDARPDATKRVGNNDRHKQEDHAVRKPIVSRTQVWKAATLATVPGIAMVSYPAHAAAASSGDTVQGLYDALLSTMKNGRTLGQSGRFMQLRDSRSPIF